MRELALFALDFEISFFGPTNVGYTEKMKKCGEKHTVLSKTE